MGLFCLKDILDLFLSTLLFEFGKNANSASSVCGLCSHIIFDLFGDNWRLRFSCVDFG